MAIRSVLNNSRLLSAALVIVVTVLSAGWLGGAFTANAQDAAAFSPNQTVVTTDGINLRVSASTAGAVIEMINEGTVGTVLAGPTSADGYSWYQVDFDGVSGYAAGEFLADTTSATTTTTSAGTLDVNTDALNVRDSGSLSGAVLETVAFGDTVTDLGATDSADEYTWAEIQTASGTTGWVVADYLTSDSSQLALTVDTVATVATDALNVRDSASLSGSVLGTIVDGDTVTILSASEAADGYLWYEVDSTAGTGWVAGEFLSV
ncbi:MAG: SH3 domain-containing protein [Thermomicrobiales bacterium]